MNKIKLMKVHKKLRSFKQIHTSMKAETIMIKKMVNVEDQLIGVSIDKTLLMSGQDQIDNRINTIILLHQKEQRRGIPKVNYVKALLNNSKMKVTQEIVFV